MQIANRIKELLLSNGIPERKIRKELADTCNISVQAVGDWFNGKTQKISPEYIATIANKYGSNSDF